MIKNVLKNRFTVAMLAVSAGLAGCKGKMAAHDSGWPGSFVDTAGYSKKIINLITDQNGMFVMVDRANPGTVKVMVHDKKGDKSLVFPAAVTDSSVEKKISDWTRYIAPSQGSYGLWLVREGHFLSDGPVDTAAVRDMYDGFKEDLVFPDVPVKDSATIATEKKNAAVKKEISEEKVIPEAVKPATVSKPAVVPVEKKEDEKPRPPAVSDGSYKYFPTRALALKSIKDEEIAHMYCWDGNKSTDLLVVRDDRDFFKGAVQFTQERAVTPDRQALVAAIERAKENFSDRAFILRQCAVEVFKGSGDPGLNDKGSYATVTDPVLGDKCHIDKTTKVILSEGSDLQGTCELEMKPAPVVAAPVAVRRKEEQRADENKYISDDFEKDVPEEAPPQEKKVSAPAPAVVKKPVSAAKPFPEVGNEPDMFDEEAAREENLGRKEKLWRETSVRSDVMVDTAKGSVIFVGRVHPLYRPLMTQNEAISAIGKDKGVYCIINVLRPSAQWKSINSHQARDPSFDMFGIMQRAKECAAKPDSSVSSNFVVGQINDKGDLIFWSSLCASGEQAKVVNENPGALRRASSGPAAAP